MTTICASRTHGEMAADTRANLDYNHTFFSSKKVWKCGDKIAAAAGSALDCCAFVEWVAGGCDKENRPTIDAEDDGFQGLILSHEGLDYYERDCSPLHIDSDFYAIGTGAQAAMAAMICGKTPKRAVEIASKIDNMTGGPFTVIRLD